MKSGTIAMTVLLLLILLPATLLAERGRFQGARGRMELGLDDEQRDEFDKLRLEHRLSNIELKAEKRKLRLKMRLELLKDEPSRKELETLAGEISIVRQKIDKNRIDYLLSVRKILKGDQWKRFLRRSERMLHGRGHRGRGGGINTRRRMPFRHRIIREEYIGEGII